MPPAAAAVAALFPPQPTVARPRPHWASGLRAGGAATAPRPAVVGGAAAGRPAQLLAVGAAAGLLVGCRLGRQASGSRAGARRAGRCGRRALPLAGGGEGSLDNYVPVAVAKPDGTVLEIDVRLTDTIRVLKAMVAMELGVPEDDQEISFDGTLIEEGVMLGQMGVKEGSRLELKVLQTEEEEGGAAHISADGEVSMRVFIKCDAAPGKAKRLGLDVTAEETAGELKTRAYEELAKTTEAFQQGTSRDYGLFVLKSPPTDAKGNFRYLRRDERLKDKQTMEENGIKGGEEILFASLFWAE